MPLLENNEQLLRMICDFLKPVYYDEHEYVFREGEPLDAMLFITQGIVLNFPTGNCEGTLSSMAECIEKGDFYGQDLLDWAFNDSPTSRNLSKLPVSTKTLKTHTKVEGFTLLANDLMTVVLRKTVAVSTMQATLRRRLLKKKNKKSTLESSSVWHCCWKASLFCRSLIVLSCAKTSSDGLLIVWIEF